MKRYKHLFFDLDHTLWDFDRNSAETLTDICHLFELDKQYGIVPIEFIRTYLEINKKMWKLFRENKIGKDEMRILRFKQALANFKIENDKLAKDIGAHYVELCPTKPHLIDGAEEVLSLLKENYHMHLLTNGFTHIQNLKIHSTGIQAFFENVIIAEDIGYKKPQKEMFQTALIHTSAGAEESLMIGDDWEADVMGAQAVGIDQVHFNPQLIKMRQKPTHEIQQLIELTALL